MINLDKLREEHQNISAELSLPETVRDRERYQQLSRRFSFLEKILNLDKSRIGYIEEKGHLEKVISNPKEEDEFKKIAKEELAGLEEKIRSVEEEIENKLFESEEPERDVIIEINKQPVKNSSDYDKLTKGLKGDALVKTSRGFLLIKSE